MNNANTHTANPSMAVKRRFRAAYAFSDSVIKLTLLAVILSMFTACSNTQEYAGYDSIALQAPANLAGPNAIHSLSEGNLVW